MFSLIVTIWLKLQRQFLIYFLPNGLFIFEVSYLVDVYEKSLFDTIYHEHLSYHSVTPLVKFFEIEK